MKKTIKLNDKIEIIENYQELLNDIQSLLEKAASKASKTIDNLKVQTYWQIGERITREELKHSERAGYGKCIIEKLAADLNLKRRLVYKIVQFYKSYPIASTLSPQLSWSHYRELAILKCQERNFYESQTIQNRWNVRKLKQAISDDLYQEFKKENKAIISPAPMELVKPEKIFKETYDFHFLKLEQGYSEKQLEEALLAKVEKLLLEFGHDFSLTGRQRKIFIDEQIHTVDIELYHRGIPCVVLVDLKREKFKSEDVGQMNKYINYYREKIMYPWEKPPVGLIVCQEKGQEEVRYALGGLENKIFVAEYKTKLPSENQISNKLKELC